MSGTDPKEILRRALLEIRALKERLVAAERGGTASPAPIAITGMACRFPGAPDLAAYARLLMEGRDAIGPRPPGRWQSDADPPGGFLPDVEGFDPRFFGLSHREAAAMDPQQRLLLEVTWEALADAATTPESLAGSRAGVFIGLATHDWLRRVPEAGLDRFFGSGSSPAVAAGRIAYLLDLRGPAMTIDTACSSSLVAIHQAMRALRAGDCDAAIVGGTALMLMPSLTRSFQEAGMLSPDGRCKSFAAGADGYGRGEGCGVVLLKRLEDAQRAADPIVALLRGSAINQDGRSAGLTAPNGPAQTALIRDALRDAGMAPDDIDYVEAHGTGTPLGDPIEWHALAAAFAGRSRPLALGSVKSNIGHSEAAAGIAGLIKAALAVRDGVAPPSLHHARRNPAISGGGAPITVATTPVSGVRRAGVSAFGFSGTNAHVVVEAPPAREAPARASLPPPVFQRERLPLPPLGAAELSDRLLAADDPLLAGTGGFAHLGVLLALLGPVGPLADVVFPAGLAVSTPRRIRLRREAGGLALESTAEGEEGWTIHLAAREVTSPATPGPPPVLPPATTDAAGLYRRIAAAGFDYGDAARCLRRIGQAGETLRGVLGGTGPGLVEAAAQLAYALLPPGAPPVMLSAIPRLLPGPGRHPVEAWLRRTGSFPDGGFIADFGLVDAAGSPVLVAESARFAPLPDRSEAWTRSIAWRPVPDTATTGLASDAWIAPSGPAASLCAALLDHLRQADDRPLRIITRGAQATGRETAPPDPDQAALWGLAMAIMAERPGRACRLIDLDPDVPEAAQQAALASELARDDETAVALRGGQRLARRLEAPPRPAGPALMARLRHGQVAWDPAPAPPPGPGELRIAMVAAGLTFRDRLLASGLAPAGSPLGADGAGIVEDVGPGVQGFAVGDAVIVLAPGAIADRVTVPALRAARAPCADLIDAATMPVPYLTALAALPAVRPGDRVLVHQATSATGLAAMEILRRAGATIIATASRPRHAWLARHGVGTVMDSRALEGWDLRGVTLGFGAFPPDLVARLAPLPLVNLDKRVAGHFDLDALPADRLPALFARLQDMPPLPRHPVARERLEEALSTASPPGRAIVLLAPPPSFVVEPGGTWIVTGAASGLGRLVADWLEDRGAVACRTDLHACEGACTAQGDIADPAFVDPLVARLASGATPLRGIIHAAAITDDDALEALTQERIAAVLHAKLGGARALDAATRRHAVRLSAFVLFSSVVGVLPSARQGAYAAANAAIDQVAEARRRDGLPGLAIAWGPWSAGIGARMGARAAATWKAFGVTPILPAMGLRALPALLAAPEARCLVADRVDAAAPAAPAARSAVAIDVPLLQGILAPLLGTPDPAMLDPQAPLTALGMDSLAAVEFARALSRHLGRAIRPDFAYSHANLAQAAAALSVARAPAPRASDGFALLAPAWETVTATAGVARGWTVAGDGPIATALRDSLGTADPTALLDVTALAMTQADPAVLREALMPPLLARLQRLAGQAARIAIALPATSPITPLVEAFAIALAAEEPAWALRTIRLDPALPDPAEALLRELAVTDGETQLRLLPRQRQAMRLRSIQQAGAWQPDPDGTWLITGASGGIGRLVAADLVRRGIRRIILASRRPVAQDLPGTRVETRAIDVSDRRAVEALVEELGRAAPPLRGIIHAAGVTADGRAATTAWSRFAPAFPPKADAAHWLDLATRAMGDVELVLFSSTAAWFGLAGTTGYAAANGALAAVAAARHQAGLPARCIAWCAWQGIGMAAEESLWNDGRAPSLPGSVALQAFDAAMASAASSLVVVGSGWQPPRGSRMMAARGGHST
ncbi:SDR family NAD(P)-dependent oxidoreductase [Falsiroseomonas stagni]|uniref:Alcohol dehydrogenase GroES-like domain-containing protein n=1 Tax=Falsiroseomonas stagni DSM 19981 TaxID=1123062 RepID=A0A1I3ZJT5_9PROT|nr:SDR family NAD(P)-dependent oxidoreductase [Falsiroseomonas stagni]SFK44190.1 Alcohol dehydrogenase GroES-like domain-containing protein [Falsiroseomonas stagni DSM 19981]